MSVETSERTNVLLRELFGPQLDMLSVSDTDTKLSDDELNSLFDKEFDRNVVYANPYTPARPTYKEKVLNVAKRAYTRMASVLARNTQRIVKPPKQVAAVDEFGVDMSPVFVPMNDGGYLFAYLPGGQVNAFYTDDNHEALAIDEIAIPGSKKNRWAIDLYSSGMKAVDTLMRSNYVAGSGKVALRGIKNFYSNMIRDLSDETSLFMTSLHEGYHHALRKLGISDELSRYDNEGLVENLTAESEGVSHTKEGTTYHNFMSRVRSGVKKMGRGFKSAIDFVKNYKPGMGKELGSYTGLSAVPA